MLSETPRVHPQVQDPGCADIAQQRRCVQLCPRIYSKRHFFGIAGPGAGLALKKGLRSAHLALPGQSIARTCD